MTQEFFKTTLVSKYIKYLLSHTPLPLYKLIQEGDIMYAGCVYTYKDKVLKCTQTGHFVGTGDSDIHTGYLTVTDEDNFSVSDKLKMSYTENGRKTLGDFTVTDKIVKLTRYLPAEYDIINTYLPGNHISGVTQQYVSNVSYYDSDTHKWLGEYLRYLDNLYGLNLMPMYNCFNYTTSDSFYLQGNDVKIGNNSTYTIMLVPVKLDKTYTVAMESSLPIKIAPVFYNNNIISSPDESEGYLHKKLDSSMITYNNMQFSNPISYHVESGNDTLLLAKYEKYLYLAIQVPKNNDTSIVVLEGDYTSNGIQSVVDISSIKSSTSKELSQMLMSRLSLLEQNDNLQHPFADKLVSYLLFNTIDPREYIDENISAIETNISYTPEYKGQWSDELRYILYTEYMKKAEDLDTLNKFDIFGFVDKDIENAVRRGYINYD